LYSFGTCLTDLEAQFSTSALLCRSRSRIVDQDLPHDPRRNRQKVGPVRKLLLRGSTKPQVGFVHKRRRLQRMLGSLSMELPSGYAAQFVVKHLRQLVEDGLISRA
jgi:hypothetical protein